jgi:hypothetical protein
MFAQNTNNPSAQQSKVEAHQTACEGVNTATFYAQPYNLDARGFYFGSMAEYNAKTEGLTDRYGSPGEEFELQFIDGSSEDAQLFSACSVNQCNLEQFFTLVDEFDDREKAALFYLADINGQSMEDAVSNLDDVNLFEGHLKEAAEELFDECYAHEIPENLRCYIDYEAFARDCELGGDMYEFEFAGKTYTCTNAACV